MTLEKSLLLKGRQCTLQKLTPAHYDELAAIVLSNPDIYRLTTLGHTAEDFSRWFDLAIAENALVIIDNNSGELVGSSRYYHVNQRVGSGKVGYTWLSPKVLGKGLNTELKYLMLTHAFEQYKWSRVGFDIDSENSRSRRAVEKLGAVLEGELRLHRRRGDETLCNTSCYSIVSDEWPLVKENLERKLAINS